MAAAGASSAGPSAAKTATTADDEYGFKTVSYKRGKGGSSNRGNGQQPSQKAAPASGQRQSVAKTPRQQTIDMAPVFGKTAEALLQEINNKVHFQGVLQVPLASATQPHMWYAPLIEAIASTTRTENQGNAQIYVQSHPPQVQTTDRYGRPVTSAYIRMNISASKEIAKALFHAMQTGIGLLPVHSTLLGSAHFSLAGSASTHLIKLTTDKFGIATAVLASLLQEGLADRPTAKIFWVGLATSTAEGTVIQHRSSPGGAAYADLPAPAVTGQNQLVALVHGLDPLLSKWQDVRTLRFSASTGAVAQTPEQPEAGVLHVVLRPIARVVSANPEQRAAPIVQQPQPSATKAAVPAIRPLAPPASAPLTTPAAVPAAESLVTPAPARTAPPAPATLKRSHAQAAAGDAEEARATYANKLNQQAPPLPPPTSKQPGAGTPKGSGGSMTGGTSKPPPSSPPPGPTTRTPGPPPAPQVQAMEVTETGAAPAAHHEVRRSLDSIDDEYGADGDDAVGMHE